MANSAEAGQSLKSDMKFHFWWGVKKVFLTGLNELYLPMQLTV
jgi:hypothetical protein